MRVASRPFDIGVRMDDGHRAPDAAAARVSLRQSLADLRAQVTVGAESDRHVKC